ncbi:prophage Lp2 protein 14 [Enterococcus faecium 1,231,408]|nr:prophage Lp2 protein 14 [Enterococcus faecium 1,231,410]EEV56861.1 prophage Lp2 protein 14 [Enterococcus faecium 1,231,408]
MKINTKRIILVISEWSAEINQKVVKNLYFVIREATNGQYYFVIKSNNNEVVATSETYLTKYSAEQTINSIKNGITEDSQVIDMTK